jgi:hypothetical protein
MKKISLVCSLAFVFSAGTALSEEGGTEAQFLMAQETSITTTFRAQLGLGLLNKPGLTGKRGTPITNYFGIDYAMDPDFGISIGIPLAGTLSSGPDDYGIGNIVLGGKYVMPLDRLRFALGANAALPTARGSARLGNFTRAYTQYVQDQFALSPYAAVAYVRDRLTLSVDFGGDVQIFTESAAGRDRLELAISYDAAAAMAIYENFWGTVEMGGYSTVTYGSNTTQLFAGPGFRYQDSEISIGVHLLAPFRQPARSAIDFLVVGDLRVVF